MRKHAQWESCQFDVFDILRFPLVILVIYIHCTIGIPEGPLAFDNILDVANMGVLLRIYISNIVSSVCVPTFFLISGYLFYYKQSCFSWVVFGRKLKRRIYSLVIPYFLWILIFLFITFLLMSYGAISIHSWKESVTNYLIENGNLRGFYDSVIIGTDPTNLPIGWQQEHSAPILFTLWYLRDLIVAILISPVLYGAIRLFHGYFILLLGIAYIFNLWPYIHGVSIVSIFYFSIGIYLSLHLKTMDYLLKRLGWLIVIAGSILSVVCLYLYYVNSTYYIYLIHTFSIIGVFLAIYIGWLLINMGARPIRLLKNSAFFIYAAHMIYINRYCTHFVLKILPGNNPLCGLLQYLLIPFVIATTCLCCFWLCQKFFPRFLSLLNGGRISS